MKKILSLILLSTILVAGSDIPSNIDYDKQDIEKAKSVISYKNDNSNTKVVDVKSASTTTNTNTSTSVTSNILDGFYVRGSLGGITNQGVTDDINIFYGFGIGYQPFEAFPIDVEIGIDAIEQNTILGELAFKTHYDNVISDFGLNAKVGYVTFKKESVPVIYAPDLGVGLTYQLSSNVKIALEYTKYLGDLDRYESGVLTTYYNF